MYNPTVPFEFDGKRYMGVRVESLESELDSQTLFAFEQDKDANLWAIDPLLGSLPLQDPSHVEINGETFILGVKVWQKKNKIEWRQDIYRGDSVKNLEYFSSGPVGMKDIRLVDLKGKVGVFTRPRGKIWGKGKIGYLEVGSVDELRTFNESDWYEGGKIIEGLFGRDKWGGVNQAINLSEGDIGIVGHIAYQRGSKSAFKKHYYGMAFRFNTKTQTPSTLNIIARRKDFPISPPKRSPELNDVIFPAGIDNTDNLYCGISDRYTGRIKITNPF